MPQAFGCWELCCTTDRSQFRKDCTRSSSEGLHPKIVSQCREQVKWVYQSRLFEVNNGIPVRAFNRLCEGQLDAA